MKKAMMCILAVLSLSSCCVIKEPCYEIRPFKKWDYYDLLYIIHQPVISLNATDVVDLNKMEKKQ